eukprot:TRINITY_DN12949_c0_g1_i1.p1 TRINITY_DN12949_c0_g1~~TRINITY_DN12949_c0_g1_i1.p1  ORF type:complete len:240 (+),score=25.85 TRINITY_DN12949_c0_g1_i1:84-722(+)
MEHEPELRPWIQQAVQQELYGRTLSDCLHDSRILCLLINAIKPQTIEDFHYEEPIPDFKAMENISMFVEESHKLGVPNHVTFLAVDLFEEKNLPLVYTHLVHLKNLINPPLKSNPPPVRYPHVVGNQSIPSPISATAPTSFAIPVVHSPPYATLPNGQPIQYIVVERTSFFVKLVQQIERFPWGEFIGGPCVFGIALGIGIRVGRSFWNKYL